MGLALVPLAGWLAFVVAVAWYPYPQVLRVAPTSTLVLDSNGSELAALASDDGRWRFPLAADEVSPHLLDAIVAVEDARFYEHHGVDWKSVAAAAWQNLKGLRIARGASTITMQVDHLRFPAARSFSNKVTQAVRAEQLERQLGKREILLEYVERAPFGANLVGAGAASRRYFGRPCRELSLAEAALLAGIPQSPNRFRPDRFPARAERRRNHVLDRMLACGFISARQRDEAAAEPVRAAWLPLPQDRPPGGLPAADGAMPTLLALAHRERGGILRTTLDGATQRQAAAVVREQLDALGASGVGAAAVVVLDNPSGECLAAVSLGDAGSQLDLTRRPRSSGSTLKPFIYAAAFDAGICGPASVLSDAPATWAGYQPSDYDRAFRGPLTAAEALAESRNVPAMVLLSKLGVQPAVGVMEAGGFRHLARDPLRYGLTLAIGGAEVTPVEVAQAYAALARGGRPMSVRFVRATTSANALDTTHAGRFLRPQSCWQVLEALSAVERTAAVCPEAVRSRVAWKTGTSSGHRDAWCAAVTRRRTVVVWLGNVGGKSSPSLVGQEAAAPAALRLIASLDPVNDPWPHVPHPRIVVGAPQGGSGGLALRSPAAGQEFVLSTDLPRDRQRVPLRATHVGAGPSAGPLWWFVDDQPVATVTDPEHVQWWDPAPGWHEVRVVDQSAHGATARIHVR